MKLTTQQMDRAAGVLLGQACGDALGVPYEFGTPPIGAPEMKGGGLGPYAPGEWSDDTQMAVCIARVASTGADLTTAAGLESVADGFLDWYATGASDVGNQTRAVLSAAQRDTGPANSRLLAASYALAASGRLTAGNGALMRTAIVGLANLADRQATARSARAVAELTHADPVAGDSCVIWSELVRVAVLTGRLNPWGALDLIPTDRRTTWGSWLKDALTDPNPARHCPNGYTVTALQAALAAVMQAGRAWDGPAQLRHGLTAAVQAGDDTDTVAAIAGGLLGALQGASAVPAEWRRKVHGWPGLRARDLIRLSVATASGGLNRDRWPARAHMSYAEQASAHRELGVPHPRDGEVLLGTMADLHRTSTLGVDAVVSLCRLGWSDVPASGVRPEDHVEVWLLDSEDPDDNAHLDFVLDDAAAAVAALRREGKRVLVHCVAAQQRAPVVAVRYAALLGVDPHTAGREISAVLPTVRGYGLLWDSAVGRPVEDPTNGRNA